MWRRPPQFLVPERPIAALKIGKRRYDRDPARASRRKSSRGDSLLRGLMVDDGANTDVVVEQQLKAFEGHTGATMPYKKTVSHIGNASGSAPVVGIVTARLPIYPDAEFEGVFRCWLVSPT